ncbi:DUF6531 domain-containing protein, partial [Metapseudomonas otitidis]|uniref:DUF6531 domain-containing protein n=1 Tax=Metapseudomonas otitidis TaxID=319939 RepID=UPI0028116125
MEKARKPYPLRAKKILRKPYPTTFKNIKMKIYQPPLIYIYLILNAPQIAYAQNYTYHLHTADAPPYSSPWASCKSVQRSGPITLYLDHIESVSGGIAYKCFHTRSDLPKLGPVWGVSTIRKGNSCPDGATFIEKTGVCQPEPTSVGNPCSEQEKNLLRQADGNCLKLTSSPSQKGGSELQSCQAQPINPATGNLHKIETEIRLPELNFQIYYNSLDGTWSHSLSSKIQTEGSLLTLTMDDGKELYFTQEKNEISQNQFKKGTLSAIKNGWIYIQENGEKYSYDSTGKLNSIETPQNQLISIIQAENDITAYSNQREILKITFLHRKIKSLE